jgi:hypothetical protein
MSNMNTYTEFFEKAQVEFLNGLKQAQELNLKAIAATTDLFSKVPTLEGDTAATAQLPTPTELVERSFAFTKQLLETRKEYLVKLAEFSTQAQSQFVDTAKRVAEAAKN